MDQNQVATAVSVLVAVPTLLRCILLVTAGLTAMYAKSAARRSIAIRLVSILLVLPWRRTVNEDLPQESSDIKNVIR